jgi:thiamine-phosphate pyrophosphorylase
MKLGVSCHNPPQVAAAAQVADYVGYGPVFATATKQNPDPVVGIAGLAAIKRAHPSLPVVAIGGIDLDRLASVKQTGADAAAMISALRDREAARRAIEIWEDA